MWFGTEAGLAKFDGRRTQTISINGLPAGRVLALQSDQSGALWIGTETGAARMLWGRFDVISETVGQSVTTIIAPEAGRVLMATEQGNVFESRVDQNGSVQTRSLLTQPLESADRERPGPLVITSLAIVNNKLFAGSLSRGVLAIEDGLAREMESHPAVLLRARAGGGPDRQTLARHARKKRRTRIIHWSGIFQTRVAMNLRPAPSPTSAPSVKMFGSQLTAAACFSFPATRKCSDLLLTAPPAACARIMFTRSFRIVKT